MADHIIFALTGLGKCRCESSALKINHYLDWLLISDHGLTTTIDFANFDNLIQGLVKGTQNLENWKNSKTFCKMLT